jgi:hypothetical protein
MDIENNIDNMSPRPAADPPPALLPPTPEDRLAHILAHTRRLLRERAIARGVALALSAAVVGALILVLVAALMGPRPLLRPLCGAYLIGAVTLLFFAVSHGRRTPLHDEQVADFWGHRACDLRSDLRSALSFHAERRRGQPTSAGHADPALVDELWRRTAAAIATLPRQGARERLLDVPALLLPPLVFAVALLWAALWPEFFLRGVRHLTQVPPDATVVSNEPLLGDIRLLLTPPRYTGLPQRTIPGSSGEVVALPGTQVRIEARALLPVDRAQLVIQAGGETATRPVQVLRERDKDRDDADRRGLPLLLSNFTVSKAGSYHFVFERRRNDKVRENEGHRIEVESDHPPRIDLFAPGDDLELSGTRRVELAYSAEDDHGLGEIDLVFRVGDKPERRKRIRPRPQPPGVKDGKDRTGPARTAAAKILWDLAELDLQPGERVGYHLEAWDLDDVNGPNRGRSRGYTLRIVSPRERHDLLLGKQEALLDQSIDLLGDRLDLTRVDLNVTDSAERVLEAHRKTEALLLQIGRLQEEAGKDGKESKDGKKPARDLRPLLVEVGRRLGKLNQEEEALLAEWRGPRGRASEAAMTAPAATAAGAGGAGGRRPAGRGRSAGPVGQMNDRHVGEMERTTLLLADLLGRQKLEDLLAISDEMTATRDRLRQLMNDYRKGRTEALKAEILREIRELERRLQQLAEKAQRLQGELPDEFLNSEAMGRNDMQGRLDRLRDLLEKGDMDRAQAELERLSQALDSMVKGMEADLRGYRRERYSAEERALSEIEDRLMDLAHDEGTLQRETEQLRGEASARARQLLKDRSEALSRRLQEQVARLRKQVAEAEVSPLGPWGSDEMEKTRRRVEDLAKMLDQGDLDEARAMAQEAEASLGLLIDELRAEEQASRFGQRGHLQRARGQLEKARPLAKEIAEEIARALPRNEELLPPERQRQAMELRARQEAIRRRAEALGREAQKKAHEIKDAATLDRLSQEMSEGLRQAGKHMERAEGELKRLSPRGAATAEGQAVERLEQMRKEMQRARRPKDEGASGRLEREPVKIPGADEYHAPKEFRQDILEAAKREAPADFREQVKRYYEELIK